MEITQEYLKEALNYDEDTGVFTWRLDRPDYHFSDQRSRNSWLRNISKSLVAGSLRRPTKRNPKQYIKIGLGGKLYSAHRLAWLYVYGEWPSEDLDHINQDTTDNRISNLRLSKDKLNHRNRGKYKNNTSGVTGISWNKRIGKWQAAGQQVVNGKRIRYYLGVYSDLFEAICARKRWELKFGYDVNHGK